MEKVNDKYQEIYSNISKARLTRWDLTLIFGMQKPIAGTTNVTVEDQIGVILSPYHFKAFVNAMNNVLDSFELQYGTINLDPDYALE